MGLFFLYQETFKWAYQLVEPSGNLILLIAVTMYFSKEFSVKAVVCLGNQFTHLFVTFEIYLP